MIGIVPLLVLCSHLAAEPSLESAKAMSGVRFGESFVGAPAAAPVETRGSGRIKTALARPRLARTEAAVPPAPSLTEAEGGSPRTEMLALAGGVVGFLGTVALTVYEPLAVGALAVGGAADGASTALQQGKKGSEVALAACRGAANGLYVFVAVGTAAGRALGERLDRAGKNIP